MRGIQFQMASEMYRAGQFPIKFFELFPEEVRNFQLARHDTDGSAGGFSEIGCTAAETAKDSIS